MDRRRHSTMLSKRQKYEAMNKNTLKFISMLKTNKEKIKKSFMNTHDQNWYFTEKLSAKGIPPCFRRTLFLSINVSDTNN